MKTCKACGREKSLDEFWRTINGYENSCKQCRSAKKYDLRIQRRIALGRAVRALTHRQVQALRLEGLRYCPRCTCVLPLEKFSHCRGGKNNSSHCLECAAQLQNETIMRADTKKQRSEKYHQRKAYLRNMSLIRKYGITIDEYNSMLLKQHGQCAICGKDSNENGKVLAVDHDHKTGKVRGLLCNNCNVAVGFLQDSPHLSIKINSYLTTEV